MLRSIFGRIAPNLLQNGAGRLSATSIYQQRDLCQSINHTVEEWVQNLPEDTQKRVRLIQNELALQTANHCKMPPLNQLQIADYKEMLELSSSRRQKYYNYLHATKTADTNEEIKKMIRAKILQEKKDANNLNPSSGGHIDYGLGKNSMIYKLTRRQIMAWRNLKLHREILSNGTPLVFDCGFGDSMTKFENIDCVRQLKYAFSQNRLDKRPFVMHYCNMREDSMLMREMKNQIPNLNQLPLMMHSKDVTEVFPSERIVYLSPDAEHQMTTFNDDDIYVIGGIVDKGIQTPLTLAKAKRLNVRSVRLPLDRYVRFHMHKTLTLDQVTNILLEMKRSQDWKKAFAYLPRRKLLG